MRFASDERGAAALEAALVLPFYITFIFAIIELGNVYWTYNSIQYVADEVARCKAINNATCDVSNTAYASAGNIWSSALAAGGEIAVSNTTCGNFSGTKITITHPITSLTGYFPNVMPAPFHQIRVQSCYPNPT